MDTGQLTKYFEEEDAKRKALPFCKRTILNIGDFIWYKIFLKAKEDWPHDIKWWFQRLFYGYSDCDVWGLNTFILRKTYHPLKKFIKNYEEQGMSLPVEFGSDPAAWLLILKKIELAFDSTWNDEFENENPFLNGLTDEQKIEHYKKVSEGFELFGRFMTSLWD